MLTQKGFFNNLQAMPLHHKPSNLIKQIAAMTGLLMRPPRVLFSVRIIRGKLRPKMMAVLSVVLLMTMAAPGDSVQAEQRFIDHGDGTVTDRKLGLMWAKTDNQTDIYWPQIQGWLENDFPDTIPRLYDNWRLPTVSELQSLFVEAPKYEGYVTDCNFAVKIVPQIRLSCILIWTSDTALGLPLAFNFNIGNAFAIEPHDNKGCRVLPVRNLN
jgi:hypothetical protein